VAVIKTRMMGDHVGLYVTALLSHCCYIAVAVIKTRMMGDHVGLYKSSFECVMSTCRGEGVRLPHHRYLTVTLPLHRCYTPSLRSGDGCLLRTTRPLHDRYSTVHTEVTLPFYCCYITVTVTLLLHQVFALWRGMFASYLRLGPHFLLTFPLYERIRVAFGLGHL
jgi:hypothetical protein